MFFLNKNFYLIIGLFTLMSCEFYEHGEYQRPDWKKDYVYDQSNTCLGKAVAQFIISKSSSTGPIEEELAVIEFTGPDGQLYYSMVNKNVNNLGAYYSSRYIFWAKLEELPEGLPPETEIILGVDSDSATDGELVEQFYKNVGKPFNDENHKWYIEAPSQVVPGGLDTIYQGYVVDTLFAGLGGAESTKNSALVNAVTADSDGNITGTDTFLNYTSASSGSWNYTMLDRNNPFFYDAAGGLTKDNEATRAQVGLPEKIVAPIFIED